MDRTPLFTIITSTYNRAHLLPRAVNSVLNQSYQNFELIIVDDGSTDNTEEVARSFEDKRVRYCKHKQNRGVLAARNTGFDLVRGDYVALLDDDDELLLEAVETAVQKFIELFAQGVKILWFDRIDFEQKERSGRGINKEGYVNYEDLLCERVYGDCWQVMQREVLENERFDERLWGEEVIFWLKLHRKFKAFYVPKVLALNYREHGERMSDYRNRFKNMTRCILTHRVFLEEYGEEVRQLCPKVYGRRLAVLGALQILNGEKLEGRKVFLQSLKHCVHFESCIVFLLSFVLGRKQIQFLALNYMDMTRYLQRLIKTVSTRCYLLLHRRAA